jgi:MSHA biogenesis protein MshI
VRQQVNLYQPIFRKQRIIFSAQTMLLSGLGFLVLLTAFAFLINHRVTSLEAELERQKQSEQRAVSQIARIRETLPPQEPDADLVAQIERLEQRRDRLEQTAQLLRTRVPESRPRLRPRLEALARQHPEGLWLTGVELGANGNRLRLRGRALSARLVPSYLDGLSGEPVLQGLAFRQVQVHTATDDLPGVTFMVSTEPGGEEESP